MGSPPFRCQSASSSAAHCPHRNDGASQLKFLEGLTDFTSHLTQSVVGNVSGGGQVMLVNPYEPEQMFLTLKSALPHGGTGPAQGKGILGTSSQFLQHHQIACPLYECRDETANMEPQPPPAKNYGTEAKITLCESKSRKPCHCTRSQCLKLYCECFANGVMCNNCDCSNCHNNAEHEMKRHNAIKVCSAFDIKLTNVFVSLKVSGNVNE
ncbi:Protein lin-54-like protein [Larimichthys crocea]|uniref:Protein lin-54-like protein n=1 Tax=Larimichthys crocea TaxID=215358 RepID=A0A6G0HDN1_LARCR|nr:Protein lin-54-like protein [Larimichthys crocea]